jgi:hypothetical protein
MQPLAEAEQAGIGVSDDDRKYYYSRTLEVGCWGGGDDGMNRRTAARLATYERQYRLLANELSEVGFIVAGSVASRPNTCGKPGCRCHGDPPQPHGPYWQWTAKVDGRTVNRRLTDREAELYQEWIANDRHLRDVIAKMREIAANATDLLLEEDLQQAERV